MPTIGRLGRNAAHRWAMLRTMVSQLVQHERIETTLPKAKELRKVADRVVTFAKRGGRNDRLQASRVISDHSLVHKLWTVLGPRYANRPGGYTRVLRFRKRYGDNATMALIEFVDRPGELRAANQISKAHDVKGHGVSEPAQKPQQAP